MSRKAVTVLDIIVLAVVIFSATAIFTISLLSEQGSKVRVTVNENKVFECSLSDTREETIETDLGYNVITVKNGNVYVSSADCRDGICERKGKINKVGESIVCLPHRLIVEVVE